jgi:Holliday junction resolvase
MRAYRVDANQREIVAVLRTAGYSVQHLHKVGEGCPDLLVGGNGVNVLLEVKDGEKPLSDQKLTPQQVIWHRIWQGQCTVVNNANEALKVVKNACK